MQQNVAERRIKSLQKAILLQIEEHPVFHALEPRAFNDLRRRVFRGTFDAYRLGVVGIAAARADQLSAFFLGWFGDDADLDPLSHQHRVEVTTMCLRAALEAFRLGAMVAVERDE